MPQKDQRPKAVDAHMALILSGMDPGMAEKADMALSGGMLFDA